MPLPIDKLTCKRAAHQPGSPYRPVVLLSCGSFNPPTVAHLRMFELAAHELAKVSLWERNLSLYILAPEAAMQIGLLTKQSSSHTSNAKPDRKTLTGWL